MSFCMKIALEENPGSAAESQVRPPNMHAFWRHVRPPKAWVREVQVRPPKVKFGRRTLHGCGGTFGPRTWPGQPPIKGSLSRKWASFFSPFRPRWALRRLSPISDVLPLNLSIFSLVFTWFWRFKLLKQVLELWELRSSFSRISKFRSSPFRSPRGKGRS